MFKNCWAKSFLVLFVFYFLCLYFFPTDAFARVGGGRSSGSLGSRSSTLPRSYSSPRSTQPSPPPSQSLAQPPPKPQSSFWKGMMGGVMGGILGGMLFRSLGFGGDPGDPGAEGSGGIGLFEIFLIGALLLGVYWYIRRRRQGTWANREMSGVRNLLTEEMSGILQGDAEKLKSGGKMNRLDNIAVRSVDLVEA